MAKEQEHSSLTRCEAILSSRVRPFRYGRGQYRSNKPTFGHAAEQPLERGQMFELHPFGAVLGAAIRPELLVSPGVIIREE